MNEVFTTLGVSHYLVVAAVLFAIGLAGVLLRRNILIILMSIELMLNAANLTVLAFARLRHDMSGQAFSMIIIAVAAAEAAVGLAIVIAIFRTARHANVDRLTTLQQ